MAALSASAAGTAEAPGQHVRQKAGLKRAILDQGWAEFRRQLEYKTAARARRRRGRETGLHELGVQPVRLCSDVGSRKTQALFACLACDHTENADVNAAHNTSCAAGRGLGSKASCLCKRPSAAPGPQGEGAQPR